MTHSLAARSRLSSSQLLRRILDGGDLAAQVQALSPAVLAKLIDRVGLEDAGEIVALATTEQLAQVFDIDLWRSDRPGEDERFDADRFLVWLEVMLEAGDSFVAERLSELPEDLVTLAFHRHMLVVGLDALMAEMQGEDGRRAEKALASCLSEELDEYHLLSRHHDGWDSVLAAVLALDRDHHDLLSRILERCSAMSAEHIEESGGLYEVLTSDEMLEADVSGDREDRRAGAGHVSPSAAAAFLKLARETGSLEPRERDPLTRAYFRGLATSGPAPSRPPARGDLGRLLAEADVAGALAARRLPRAAGSDEGHAEEPLLVRAMRKLSEEDAPRFFERSEEIAYLANVVVAGCSFQGRRMRPVEAVRAVIATCSLALELSAKRSDVEPLRDRPADALFRMAWSRLHRDVVRPASELRTGAGHEPLVLDALRALSDECPTLAGVLAQEAGEFGEPRFIATAHSLDAARALLAAAASRSAARPRAQVPRERRRR